MASEYPDRPSNRPDPIIEDGHKAPDERKRDRSYLPIALAAAAILLLAAVATISANLSQDQVERGEAHKQAETGKK